MISIIVPIYNVEPYLAECIDSLICQTYENLQIILVDDGSTDNSGLICDQYKEQDERIVVIHQINMGLVVARKVGLNIATGDYIGFVDGDDYVEPTMYEQLLEYMLAENVDVVHTGYIVNKWGTDRKVIQYEKKVINNSLELLNDTLSSKTKIAPSIWSKLFKKELIQECYADVNDNASYGEDLICLISVLIKQCKIALIDEAFYHYREREDSISHRRKAGTYKKEILLCENVKETLQKGDILNNYMSEYCIFVRDHIIIALQRDSNNDFAIQKYVFPNPEILQNKKIVIMGAGKVGKDFYSQICRYNNCEVVAWIDNYPENYHYEYIDIKSSDVILRTEFDVIILAALREQMAEELRDSLNSYNISDNKIIWIEPYSDI